MALAGGGRLARAMKGGNILNTSTLPHFAQVIAVDFDGTLCSNAWPGIGKPNRQLIETLIERKRAHGVKLILLKWEAGENA